MTAFKNIYEKARYTDNLKFVDEAVLRKIVETIKGYIAQNIYKGKAGEAFRLATCRLLECLSIVNIPLEDK